MVYRILGVLGAALVAACEGAAASEDAASDAAPDTGGFSVTGAADDPATTTTGVDASTSAAGDTTAGASFIVPTDAGGTDKACDNWAQDCPSGQKCSAYANDGGSSWNALKCVPVAEPADAVGEPCTVEGNGVSGFDSCGVGAMCWDVEPTTGVGVCVALCIGSPESPKCGDPGTSCVIANSGVLNLCLGGCEPLLQDCPGDDLCLPNPQGSDDFVCVLDASGESGKVFDPCEYGNACDKGMLCVDPGLAAECSPDALGCCLPFCDLTDPDCPGAGQDCLPWFESGQAPPGREDLGVCGLPS